MGFLAGLDWGSEEHAVCVINEDGRIVLEFSVAHTRAGLEKLQKRLARLAPPQEVPISIERPNGLIVDVLIEAGHPVIPIHPNVVKASRPRYRAAGSKSDRGDGYLLADLLRTDGHRFEVLKPSSGAVKALRALVRTREDLVSGRVGLANQLRALLESFWPGAADLFSAIDSPISLAFLERYPTPTSAKHLGPQRMGSFLAKRGYSGGRSAQELLARLRGAPQGLACPAEEAAKGALCQALVHVLEPLGVEIRKLTRQIEQAVGQLQSGQVLMSFPRAGRLTAAKILAELGEDPGRFPSESQLAAEAGVCPVTHESGKHRRVVFRWACNNHLRQALTCFADNSRHESPWAEHLYAQARGRGCKHPQAVRIVARAWVRVLWRAWTNGELYDVAKHGGAQAFLAAAA